MQLEWTSAIIGFVSALAVALIAAFGGNAFQRRADRRAKRDRVRFRVYMKLMELKGLYFAVTTREMRGLDRPDRDTLQRMRDLSWQALDLLREADDVEYLDEIGTVLLSQEFKTARERARVLDGTLQKLGALANPQYTLMERRISESTQWYYWPNDDYTGGTYQYPMTLPLPSAPGRSKFSEFFPMIYSYAYNNPCGLIEK